MTTVSAATVLPDFGEMMRQVVLPMHLDNPSHTRLDSPRTDGNWEVLCRFRWKGQVWKVHGDSHYEPLLLAYYGWQFGPGEDVFQVANMKAGVRLDIIPELAAVRPGSPRRLYLYRDEAGG